MSAQLRDADLKSQHRAHRLIFGIFAAHAGVAARADREPELANSDVDVNRVEQAARRTQIVAPWRIEFATFGGVVAGAFQKLAAVEHEEQAVV